MVRLTLDSPIGVQLAYGQFSPRTLVVLNNPTKKVKPGLMYLESTEYKLLKHVALVLYWRFLYVRIPPYVVSMMKKQKCLNATSKRTSLDYKSFEN